VSQPDSRASGAYIGARAHSGRIGAGGFTGRLATPQMTPEQKREIIDTTYLQMITSARRGLEQFERTKRRPAV
jgi:hypothetical protein